MSPGLQMTIDELARRAETTTRNVRAYQTRGLLPPPRMVGRVGYYDDGHLARLKYIANLQRRGFSLAAINDLLRGWEQGRSLADVLGFEDALTAPWSDEAPERFSRAQLEQLFPSVGADEALVERAVALGLLAPHGDGFVAPSPRLLRVGAELVAAGIPLSVALDEHERLAADVDRVARRFVGLFERYVWEPFVAAGLPPDRLPAVTEALRRLRPTVAAAVGAALARAMERVVAASAAEQVARFMPPSPTGAGQVAPGGLSPAGGPGP